MSAPEHVTVSRQVSTTRVAVSVPASFVIDRCEDKTDGVVKHVRFTWAIYDPQGRSIRTSLWPHLGNEAAAAREATRALRTWAKEFRKLAGLTK